jgi:hypothetical protein
MPYSRRMHDAITRSTFAYAAVLFAVLFAPQVGLSDHDAGGAFLGVFPSAVSLLLMLAIVFVAVRHAMAGQAGAPWARGFARGTAVSCIGAILYAIGIAVLGPAVFPDRGFTRSVVAVSAVVVTLLGTGASALFAFLALRAAATGGRVA